MKDTIYYKVVSVSPTGQMFSAVKHVRGAILKYSIGKKTTPKFGKIFIFETLEQARHFVKSGLADWYHQENNTIQILSTYCGEIFKNPIRTMYAWAPLRDLRYVWERPHDEYSFSFRGTLLTDWVIPIQIIE